MKSKTSLFNPALFRKNLTRFAPLWGIFLGLMLLAGPVTILTSKRWDNSDLSNVLSGLRYTAVLYNFFYAPLCAGLLFRYLHQERSAYMMHAYPLNRSTQFVTNVLSGFCFAVVPFVLQLGLNLLSSIGMTGQYYLVHLLAVELLSFAFFFGLAVFCMHLSGNTIISVLSYFALNFLFAAVPALLISLINSVSFGFDFSAVDDKLIYLAPMLRMMSAIVTGSSDMTGADWIMFGAYGLLGAGLLVLSWLLYRVRHLEQAGEAMAFRGARAAFLALFTILCTLGLGVLLTSLFVESVGTWRKTLPPTLLFFLLASFAGWFGAQMMLKRTVRVFQKRTVLGWVGIAAAMVALICCLKFDVLGTQRYVPEQEELQGATLILNTSNYSSKSNLDATLDVNDPEALAAVRTAHRDAYTFYCDKGQHYSYQLTVCYRLRSGRTVNRAFNISDGNLLQISKLLDKPEYAMQYYEDILPKAFQGKKYFSLEYYDFYSNGENDKIRIFTDRDALQEAMLRDAAEGNLPIPFLKTVQPFDWHMTANIAVETYGEMSDLEIADTAEHTLELFGVEP